MATPPRLHVYLLSSCFYLVNFIPDVDPLSVVSLTARSYVNLAQRLGAGVGEKLHLVLGQTGITTSFLLAQEISMNGGGQLIPLLQRQVI